MRFVNQQTDILILFIVFLTSAQLIPSILFMLMGAVGCNYGTEVIVLTAASLLGGCASSGPIVNSVDLAPNFSGALLIPIK
jgi:hypothetical protein